MVLKELVPEESVCKRLERAGFPQDMSALVWVRSVSRGNMIVTRNEYEEKKLHDNADRLEFICAAPTTQEMYDWLSMPTDNKERASDTSLDSANFLARSILSVAESVHTSTEKESER
jgi:hypothetical protein